MLIAPSLLSADFTQLDREIAMVNRSDADWFHIDVMDGVFVPNISFGQNIIKQIKHLAKKPLDVHLMIIDPDRYLGSFKDAGADHILVQYEACTHLDRSLHKIKSLGLKAGVVLNPHTSVNLLENIAKIVDIVLIMSVNPGFGGQKFIENSYRKIVQLKQLRDVTKANFLIEVDGGVSIENVRQLADAGADVLVAGNSIFGAQNPEHYITNLKW
ncbi:MAG: ribulose-phosphate 3-epimerase [Bacteroidales bacterium]|jgi:ribulose-phosphate 3-epimerase|nr:ribulose-phosphate 3-epimerase [Bacteroidales bacterium]